MDKAKCLYRKQPGYQTYMISVCPITDIKMGDNKQMFSKQMAEVKREGTDVSTGKTAE